MTRNQIQKIAEQYVTNSPFNTVGPQTADSEGYYGLRICDSPLMGIAKADDPMFNELLEPQIVGPQMLLPQEWLKSAKSIISFFLPSSAKVKEETLNNKNRIAKEWLYARTDAQLVIVSLVNYISSLLMQKGFEVCVPSDNPRFTFRGSLKQLPYGGQLDNFEQYGCEEDYYKYISEDYYNRTHSVDFPPYSSNWSERHVAYTCGLGTFSLSTNLITKRGSSGRFMSLVTDWCPEYYDVRPYTDFMEYCNHCGKCISRCPGSAIDINGKSKKKCHDYFSDMLLYSNAYLPRYGCGQCQTGMPCDSEIPKPSIPSEEDK